MSSISCPAFCTYVCASLHTQMHVEIPACRAHHVHTHIHTCKQKRVLHAYAHPVAQHCCPYRNNPHHHPSTFAYCRLLPKAPRLQPRRSSSYANLRHTAGCEYEPKNLDVPVVIVSSEADSGLCPVLRTLFALDPVFVFLTLSLSL